MAKRPRSRKKLTATDKPDSVRLVEDLITYALIGIEDSGVISRYNRGMKYWRGDHDIKTRDKKLGNNAYNKFAEIVETRLSHLTDARPKWLFKPQEETDMQTTHALNQIMGDVVWDYINWDKGEDGGGKSEDAMQQAAFAGSCHIKTVLDVHNGYPNFVVRQCGSILVDPKAKKKKQLRFWIDLVPTSVEHIKKQYGKTVTPQLELEKIRNYNRADFHRPMITAQMNTTAETIPATPFLIDKDGKTGEMGEPGKLGQAIIAECWLESHEMIAIPFDETETDREHDALKSGNAKNVIPQAKEHHPKHIDAHQAFLDTLDTEADAEVILAVQQHINFHRQFPQETRVKKYPMGRVISVCQGQLLEDRPNPFGSAGLSFRDVLIKFDYYKDPENYWGKPLTSDLFDPQNDLNHRKNSITRNINLLNNGIRKVKWTLYEKLGLKDNPSRANNLPGQIIPFINHPDEWTTDFGTALPGQVWGDLNWTERFMETSSLHNDAAAGRMPSAGTANVTLETLLGEFKTILRKPLRHYAGALSEMGTNAVLLMARYMPDSEKFLILGQDQKTFETVKWGDLRSRAAMIRNVRIDTTQLMPTTRNETFNRVIQLMQAGVPPDAAVQLLDDPKAIQVMASMSQLRQLQQAVEGLAAENKELKTQINTLANRAQSDAGVGNTGIFNNSGG